MWRFKIKQVLIFISIFLVLYAVLLSISALISFKDGDLTTGEKMYGEIVVLIVSFPLNPLWNDGRWPFVIFTLNGSFWGVICYTIIFGLKKLKGKHNR